MKKQTVKLLALATFVGLMITSCKKDKDDVVTPTPPNENEVITTFTIIATDSADAAATPLKFTWKDLDGDGAALPTRFDTIKLAPNKTYYTQLLILDETKTPADTTSKAIEEEAAEHQFFFTPEWAHLTVTYNDKDKNNVPLGLSTKFTTGSTSSGKVQIVLKHQPDEKPKSGNGDASKGSVDIDLTFKVKIE